MMLTTDPDQPTRTAVRTSAGRGRAWRCCIAGTAAGALLTGLVAAPAQAAAAGPAPVVHYTFDEPARGGVVSDSSGNGIDARLVGAGATQVAGEAGSALGLPGGSAATGAHVELPRAVLEGAADLTLSMRVRWSGGAAWQWVAGLGSDTSRYLFVTPAAGPGQLRTAITSDGAGAEAQTDGSAALPGDGWRDVTVTLDTGADRLTTYLDGAEVARATTTVSAADLLTDGATSAGSIGRSFYPDPLFAGAVDDVQVFHEALTAAQVDALVPGDAPTAGALPTTAYDLRTEAGTAPQLPTGVTAGFSDGYDRRVPVTWEAVPASRYAAPGRFTVRGDAAGTPVTAAVTVVRAGQLTIDLGGDTGAFQGGAAGVLYGLYGDGMPTDNLIEGFGLRTVATKGQDGSQHPGSDALEVLGQLDRTSGGKVYVRTTDFYRGFPYQWPGDTPQEKLDGYLEVMATQLDDIAALLAERPELADNVVIEPFNEPEGNMFGDGEWSYDGTSWLTDPTDFFAAWDRSHALITEKLPGVEIAGPGTSLLFDQVRGYLEHTVEAGTTPDIITWHELSDPARVRSSVARFRDWEDEVYDGSDLEGEHLPINVNEYAFNYHTSVPGQMVQWMSGVEESKVEAMIAFWNMNGNLSDSAVQSNRGNGQWWLYNAYSAMTGKTVPVTPPQPGVSYTLQGVATLDEDRKLATALLGGAGGAAYVDVDGVPADVFGDEVRVTVREIRWTGQLGDSAEPRLVGEFTAPVRDGAVGLDFGGADLPQLVESSAYQVQVTPVGTGRTTAARPTSFEASYEAEAAAYTGGGRSVNGPEGSPQNVAGFFTSGGRNVGGLRTGSDGAMDFTVDVPEDGTYDLSVFSSTLNTFPAVQEQGPTNIFLRVDGAAEQELFLPLAYKWVVWDHRDTTVELTKGRHTITLAARSADGTRRTRGDAIVDRITLAKPTGAPSVYEAELAELGGSEADFAIPAAQEVSGAGGAVVGDADELTFWVYSEEEGESALDLDLAGSGRASLTVNGDEVAASTGSASLPVYLSGGVNKVVVSGAGGEATVDRLVVTPGGDALPTTTVEAETGTTSGTAQVVDLSLASGGKAVDAVGGDPGNDNTLTLDVTAAQAGKHAVTLRFSNPEQLPATHYNPNPMGRFAQLSVNGGEGEEIAFVPTFHRNNFWERTVVVDLAAGANTLTLSAEERPNWDGDSYAEDLWPGLPLRSAFAPILDRVVVAPLTAAAAVAPAAPTEVAARTGAASARVSWKAPALAAGEVVTGYAVTSSPGGRSCATTGATECVVSGLTNGTSYTFAVTATTKGGTSVPSMPSAPVTPSVAPGTPKQVSLTVSAKASCTGGRQQIVVHVLNKEAVPAAVFLKTPFGEVEVKALRAGASLSRTFTGPTGGTLAAGTVQVGGLTQIKGVTGYTKYDAGHTGAVCPWHHPPPTPWDRTPSPERGPTGRQGAGAAVGDEVAGVSPGRSGRRCGRRPGPGRAGPGGRPPGTRPARRTLASRRRSRPRRRRPRAR